MNAESFGENKAKDGNTLPITPKAHGFINETIYTTWFMPPEVFPSTLPIPPLLLLRGLGHTGATLWKERLTWLLPIIRESLILRKFLFLLPRPGFIEWRRL